MKKNNNSNNQKLELIIPEEDYKEKDKIANKAYSVFSSLDILNKNNDLFKSTKNTTITALKTIFNAKELQNLLQKTNNRNLEVFAKQVKKAMNGKNSDVTLNAVASSVKEFLTKVNKNEAKSTDDVNFDKENLKSTVEKRASGPRNLVNQVTRVYGENRYYKENVQTETLKMTPLFVKFNNNTEAINKANEIAQHIKSKYKYNIIYSNHANPINVLKRNIRVEKYSGSMDSCINMLYSVAKTLVGSKKINLNLAKKMLDKNEYNDYLNAKGLVKKYGDEKVSDIFKQQKETIKDVISTLSTIFMARFVFEAPLFAEIERDLTEQACLKMRTLRISKESNDDYWINQLIEDRLKVNVSQILAANEIREVNDLKEIYDKNGTIIANPDKITNLEDLVFAVQYNNPTSVENKKIEHAKKSLAKYVKPVIKRHLKIKKQKSNKFLDEVIRKSEAYKKYYEEYLERYKNLEINDENVKKLEQEKNKIDGELDKTSQFDETTKITDDEKEKIANKTAQSDAIGTVLSLADENSEENDDEQTENVSEEEKAEKQENKAEDADSKQKNDKQEEKGEDKSEKAETTEKEKKTENEDKKVVFKTHKKVQALADETVLRKIKKYFEKTVFGQNGKAGVVGERLNYRVIEKSNKKTTYASDNERLDDKDLTLANKIRDEKASEVVESFSGKAFEYYQTYKDNLKNLTIPSLCNEAIKINLNFASADKFTNADLKKLMSVVIAKQANEELKENNIELYTGKKTFKNYEKIAKNVEEDYDKK